jgi:hypothetical protein
MSKTKVKPKKRKTAAPPSANGQAQKPETPTAELAAESLQRIARVERELEGAEQAETDAKVVAREAKAKKERLRKHLAEVIREETGAEPNLFTAKTAAAVASANGQASPAKQVEDESWRNEKLENLVLPGRIITILAELDIHTLGHLTDWQDPNKNGGKYNRLEQVKGLKGASITTIEEATSKFWADWNERQKERKAQAKEVVEDVAEATQLDAGDEGGE